MEIVVSDFKKALEVVKPGLATTVVEIDQVTSFAFTGDSVTTFNNEICITHPLSNLEIHGAIEAELLYKFLSKVKADKITLSIDDTSVEMKSGRMKATFSIEPEIKLPLKDEKLITKGKWKKLPETFAGDVSMVKSCVSKDMIKPKLNCVHFNKEGFIESSDGFRIFRYSYEDKLPMQTMLIPESSVNSLIQMNPTHVAKGDEWIHFKNAGGTVLSCRTLDDEFPETEEFLKKGKKGIKITFPKELIAALDVAEIFTDNHMVKLAIDKDELTISSESQIASYKEKLTLDSDVAPFAFYITPYLLRDILRQIQYCTIYKDKLIFKSDNWTYMTMLTVTED